MTVMTVERGAPHVTLAGAERATALSSALAAAFHDDPVFRWFSPGDGRRRAMLPGFFDVFVEAFMRHGEAYADAGFAGAALWSYPGSDPIADGPGYAERLGELAGTDAERLFTIVETLEAVAPQEPHYHLQFLGVRPEHQGQGLGGALMAPVLERCDREGVPAYLEATSDRNRAMYERHGFECRAAILVPGGPVLWHMWRDPVSG
jgi:GNAT superfamily N-acetyltransferase